MRHISLFFALPLIVSGCAMAATGSVPPASTPAPAASTALRTPIWQLQSAQNGHGLPLIVRPASPVKPLQLDLADGHLRVLHACNAMGSDYHIVGDHLKVGAIISTMMACRDAALNQRSHAVKAFLRQPLNFVISHQDGHPVLTLTSADGSQWVFVGKPRKPARKP